MPKILNFKTNLLNKILLTNLNKEIIHVTINFNLLYNNCIHNWCCPWFTCKSTKEVSLSTRDRKVGRGRSFGGRFTIKWFTIK